MSESLQGTGAASVEDADALIRARREKMRRWREELGIDPYGGRVEGLIPLAEARALYSEEANAQHEAGGEGDDPRPRARVAGRCIQHREMGKLVFMVLRDASGDLQVSISKAAVSAEAFKLAAKLDYGDIVMAEGPVGKTKRGEICIWADRFELQTKSLAPPPEKYHGLTDPELRYRQRYVDMYANPETVRTFMQRSEIVSFMRRYLEGRGFIEVETPMMQPIPGGAAARPFVTHHNALDIDLYMRIAPELYLKRLLVGGMPRVFEINRNFRNEGISQRHNPEFTMLELYEAFGNYETMMELTEGMLRAAAKEVMGEMTLPFGEMKIDYGQPFRRACYLDLFEEHNGFAASDHERLLAKAHQLKVETKGKAHDVILQSVWEETVEHHLVQPTFVKDYPASLCPLTRQKKSDPSVAERFELYVAKMEVANAYTELNDPDVQEANFRMQIEGLDDEETTFRNVDEDFLHALRVGMPPAGGLGVGVDRVIMLLTNHRSIRDVILFPLMKPEGSS